jgi:D-alanyl-D-alanine dipeptidase
MKWKTRLVWIVLIVIFVGSSPLLAEEAPLPDGFVYLEKVISDIDIDLRYVTNNNFVGQPVDGYVASRCIITKEAAMALKAVQADLRPFGLGLKVFDAYRPQMAVDHFVRWARDLTDTRMKSIYYPDIDKKDLFSKGYIASKSGHTRGSTVDLTLVAKSPEGTIAELDMGTPFDFFGTRSWVRSSAIGPDQRAHRMLLQTLMKKHGFRPYRKEWWHFTLKNEPFPDTYFNFKVQ